MENYNGFLKRQTSLFDDFNEGLLVKAKPFLKWAGGKRQLLDQISNYLPNELETREIVTYCEPFVGSGAVFFFLINKYPHLNSFLFDTNPDLIVAYKTIKFYPEPLNEALQELESWYKAKDEEERKVAFLEIRRKFNNSRKEILYHEPNPDWIMLTSRLIFLNRTCFNGLYRVNSKGEFNVPFGDNKNPKISDRPNINAVSQALQKTTIIEGDFSIAMPHIDKRTFVYFDPPYKPITKSSSFTAYSKDAFDDGEQLRLASFFREIDQKHAKAMLSNSDPQNTNMCDNFFIDAYRGFRIVKVDAKRVINSKAEGRGSIKELLIMNY